MRGHASNAITLALLVSVVGISALGWVANASARTRGKAPGCTAVFPFAEGNPWHTTAVGADELNDTLWNIDQSPDLELVSIAGIDGQPACFAVTYKE